MKVLHLNDKAAYIKVCLSDDGFTHLLYKEKYYKWAPNKTKILTHTHIHTYIQTT